MIKDKHDPRSFRHFAKLAADGTVLAVVEVAAGAPMPPEADAFLHVDVTALHPYDLSGVKISKATVDTRDHQAIAAALKTANKVPPKDAHGR